MATKKTSAAAEPLPWEEQVKGKKTTTKKAAAPVAEKPVTKRGAAQKKAETETAGYAADTAQRMAERAKKGAKAAASVPDEPKYKYPDGWKAPKTLAQAADRLFETRQKRLALQKQVDAMQADETALKMHLLENLPKDKASGIAGKLARVTAVTKDVPRVEDWSKVYDHIVAEYNSHKRKKDGLQAGAFALLGRTIGKKAVEEAWNAGKTVPGVGTFTVNDISVNKV